jgi:hypothetical protein
MELKNSLAGKTPEEQTAWLKAHMRNWDEFVAGIVQGREQLAGWRAAGNTGYPPSWITLEEFRRERELSTSSE